MTTPKALLDPATQQPVGALVNAGSARDPRAVVLKGRFGRIEKLDPSRHRADLWLALSGHDHIWTYMAYGPFADAEAFGLRLKGGAGITDPFSYVIVDRAGPACGLMALMVGRPEARVLQIGNVVLGPAIPPARL